MRLTAPVPCVQDLGTQDHVAGRIGSVHIAERCRDQIATTLAGTKRLGDAEQIGRGGVQLVAPAGGTSNPVLLTADNAGLDLEDDVKLAASGEQRGRYPQVLLERKRRAVEHVGLKQGGGAEADTPLGFGQQWQQPIIDARRRAVIGVEGDEDGARRGDSCA